MKEEGRRSYGVSDKLIWHRREGKIGRYVKNITAGNQAHNQIKCTNETLPASFAPSADLIRRKPIH